MENCIVCGRDIGEHKPRLRITTMDKEGVALTIMCHGCVMRIGKMSAKDFGELIRMMLLCVQYPLPTEEQWAKMTKDNDDERNFTVPK